MSTFHCKTHDVTLTISRDEYGWEHRDVKGMRGSVGPCSLSNGKSETALRTHIHNYRAGNLSGLYRATVSMPQRGSGGVPKVAVEEIEEVQE